MLTKTPINPETVISDSTKLVTDLCHQRLILINPHRLSSGRDINQSTDDARLRVSNLDRLVSANEEEGINTLRLALHTLLVDQNRLVGNNAVKKAISLDPGEVSILINGHERTLAERAGRKLI